ncbi:unnamed protein product [Ixodes persulcatus]
MQELPTLKDIAVPVQAYLISGKDLRRKVVNGVHPGETPEGLLESLTCWSHQMISARYMGSGRTCLVTLQVPPSPPDRITYYGCILSSRLYCPAVIQVLQCSRLGHMHSSCPCPSDSTMESSETATYKCGLCKTNGHKITANACPKK